MEVYHDAFFIEGWITNEEREGKNMKYGLIGGSLGHSFSKLIHEQLTDYTYELQPLKPQEFEKFMKQKEFTAINVTIPYKQAVLPYLQEIDKKAERIGAVNTIVQRDGALYGYNTDYDGFLYMLRKHNVNVCGKRTLILGDGGAAQAVKAVLQAEGSKEFYSVRRKKTSTSYTYEEIVAQHKDIDIIINTSPVGMYPDCDASALNIEDFPHCTHVIDVIYNPLHTKLLVEAKQKGMYVIGGLEMLVAQAKYAIEHFQNCSLPDACIDEIYRSLLKEKGNIVLIGMPSCGKTTLGKALAKALNKTYFDSDEELVKQFKRSIKDIIQQDGESAFRKLEAATIGELSTKNNCVIATGGGCVKNQSNMQQLKMNGILLWIQRDIANLLVDEERPLSSSKEAIQSMYQERKPLYEYHADAIIQNDDTIDHALEKALAAYEKAIQTY